jgi:hypothetical protein
MGEDCPGRQAEALIATSRQPVRSELGRSFRLDGLTNASMRPVIVVAGDAEPITAALEATFESLGYECNHQQNLKTMRGAKSNALFLKRTNCNSACPCVALVIRATFGTVFLSTPFSE